MMKRTFFALLIVCLAYALTACGGGGDDPDHPDLKRTKQPVDCLTGGCS